MSNRSLIHALFALAVLWTGCSSSLDRYVCSTSEDCQSSDPTGRCEASGSCSFVDPNCNSNRRYGEAAGNDSNTCVEDTTLVDAGADANDDTCEWSLGFDILNIGPCGPGADPSEELVLGFASYLDTTTGVWNGTGAEVEFHYTIVEQSDGTELFVVTTNRFESPLLSSFIVAGSRPLVIIAKQGIVIRGSVSVSASGSTSGAGGLDACTVGEGLDNGGGGGGGFGTAGASGGVGSDNSTAGVGGNENSTDLTPLRGGCRGGNGGGSEDDEGGGGGAIQLVSGAGIEISGLLAAGGGGGAGGEPVMSMSLQSGGTGGGSGGAILLQARSIEAEDELLIVGGGGGGGGGGGLEGQPGQDANNSLAKGGNGGESDLGGGGEPVGAGGIGGDGASNTSDAMQGSDSTASSGVVRGAGGGGGGGLGVIRKKIEP